MWFDGMFDGVHGGRVQTETETETEIESGRGVGEWRLAIGGVAIGGQKDVLYICTVFHDWIS